jgi:exopolysaccharide biosynthesis predicted pyruvyltransferase EpsI
MKLAQDDQYAEILSILEGRNIIYVRGGNEKNAGSSLTDAGTMALFGRYGVQIMNDWERTELPEDDRGAEFLVYGGGGTLGTLYPKKVAERRFLNRRYCDELGMPVIVLPQSHCGIGDEDRPPLATIFVRERWTQELIRESILCPDMSMCMEIDQSKYGKPDRQHGIFLRADAESHMRKRVAGASLGDPADYCKNYLDYLDLVSHFESITTDRLMLAVCGLLLSKNVTLLPNSSHKNLSYYETWLKELGCHFKKPFI